jgi:deoxycytidine triphosphate deaminase
MSISEVGPDHKAKEIFRFDESHKSFSFAPQKYYLIDILEEIRLPKGIIGRFIPSSSFIELGLSITAGKIEYPYGQNKERIRFGIFNCLTIETTIFNDYRIAYVEFFDLRGLANLEYQLTPYDKNIYIERTHDDWDGPNYERDNRE